MIDTRSRSGLDVDSLFELLVKLGIPLFFCLSMDLQAKPGPTGNEAGWHGDYE